MPDLLLYLLKANVALALFYLAYHFMLRRLTFYNLNRAFLLFGILFSALYPLVDLSSLFSQHQELAVVNTYVAAIPAFTVAPATPVQNPVFDFWRLPVYLFWLGAAVVAARLVLQFVSLYRIHTLSAPAMHKSINYRKVESINHAFSFWQSIYLNPKKHKQAELDAILNHELVHVKGWHTLDVLLTELSIIFYWFSPSGWLMKRAVKENLEFIADKNVVATGVNRKDYQYLLLKVTGISEPQIANQFNFSPLKTRIAMMNKMPTKKANRLRLLIVLPLVTVLLVAFRSTELPEKNLSAAFSEITAGQVQPNATATDEYAAFYSRNPQVSKVSWRSGGKIIIELRSGKEETYQFGSKQSMAAAEKKYGKLPSGPPVVKRDKINQSPAQDKPNLPEDYKAFYSRNPQVRKLDWISSHEIRVRLESTEEVYNLADKESRAAAEKKYGKLPSTPPPARVVTEDEFEAQTNKTEPQDGIFTIIPDDTGYYSDRNKLPIEYTNFLKKNPSVDKVGWRVHSDKGPQAILIYLKSGATEVYDYSSAKSMATAKNKYGELPNLLPPPPPVRIKKN